MKSISKHIFSEYILKMKPANRNNLCNKPYAYFTEDNLRELHAIFDHNISLEFSNWFNQLPKYNQPYGELVNHLKRHNNQLYEKIKSCVIRRSNIEGDMETKIFFAIGRQFYSDLDRLTNDEKNRLITVSKAILQKNICCPKVRPVHYVPRWIKNDGTTELANGHNMGNLRTAINHLESENAIKLKWSQCCNDDFVGAKLVGYPKLEKDLQLYIEKIAISMSQNNLEIETERNFAFEAIVRDLIRTEIAGQSLTGIEVPKFNSLELYKHGSFETDVLGENDRQRWIIEITRGHKTSSEIIRKYNQRKKHFDKTLGEKETTFWFIVGNHGKFDHKNIKLTRIDEFKSILYKNKIRDVLSCIGF